MLNTVKELTECASFALKKQTFEGPISDPQSFLLMTLENGLAGLVYSVCSEEILPSPFYERLQEAHYAYIASDAQQDNVVQSVSALFKQHKIPFVFLKGTHLKQLYPDPFMRAMGDVDLLVKEETMQNVTRLFLDNHVKRISQSVQHDVFVMNGVTIEVHPTLFKAFDKRYEKLMRSPWDYIRCDDVCEFEKPYECVYLLYHLAKHLNSGGIGLRSLLDIGIYLKAYHESIDKDELFKLLDQVELRSFFNHIVTMNIRYFKFDTLNDYLDKSLSESINYDEVMVFFALSGIHGKGKSFNPFEVRYASHKSNQKRRLSFYLSILLPSYKTMKGMYPWLRFMPLLYPFTWGIRGVRLMLFKRKSSWRKIKQLQFDDEQVDLIQSLYKKLGL